MIRKYFFLAFPVIFYQAFILHIMLGLIALLVMITVGIVFLLSSKEFKVEYRRPGLNIVLFMAIWLAAHANMVYQKDRGMTNSEKLVAALDAYYKDHGRFPAKLSQLKPLYVSHIPYFWFGIIPVKFSYAAQSGRYSLTIAYGSYNKCYFDADGGECIEQFL